MIKLKTLIPNSTEFKNFLIFNNIVGREIFLKLFYLKVLGYLQKTPWSPSFNHCFLNSNPFQWTDVPLHNCLNASYHMSRFCMLWHATKPPCQNYKTTYFVRKHAKTHITLLGASIIKLFKKCLTVHLSGIFNVIIINFAISLMPWVMATAQIYMRFCIWNFLT